MAVFEEKFEEIKQAMNILYFCKFLSPVGGGGDVVFYLLMKRMLTLGHKVHIICYDAPNRELGMLEGANIHKIKPIITDEVGRFLSINQHFTYMVNAFRKGRYIIKNEKIDIIHANVLTPVIPATLLGKLHRIPVIITIHDLYKTSSKNYWKTWSSQDNISWLSSFIGEFYERVIVRFPVSRIHVVSNATKQDVLNINHRAKISLIYNGIEEDNDSSRYGCEYQKFVLFIGRLIISKNLEVVIRAFSGVTVIIPDAKLIVLGEGPMRKKWEELVADLKLTDNIEFRGFVPKEEKLRLLSKCSALVFPSLHEGFGLVILEAFVMSKPALVADVQPFDEIIENDIDGFLIQPDRVDSWSEKIIAILTDRANCERMGVNGRKKVLEKFHSLSASKQMEELYFEISSKTARNS